MIELKKIFSDHPELFETVFGPTDVSFEKVTPPDSSGTNALCFVSTTSQLASLDATHSKLWVASKALLAKQRDALLTLAQAHSATLLSCANIQVAMAHTLKYFDRHPELMAFPSGISPQSWIHPTARIGKNATIAPFCTIGPNVEINEGAIVGPHCLIEGEAIIGAHSFLEGHVFIGRQVQVGHHCRIKPFASIGTNGFGYAPTNEGALSIPQIGTVVIEDHVDIGSGTCIDRATITQTRIGRGTKIDNLVHIAHNCDIGKYCFVTAHFAMAGSSKIGDFFMTGGTSAVGDHVTIHEKVTLAGASVVTSDIDKPGAYGGNPVQPMQDYLKTRSISGQLPQMRKQLHKIIKHLGLED